MAGTGINTWIAQGNYVRPVISALIGEILLTAEDVAEGIAQQDKKRLFLPAPMQWNC